MASTLRWTSADLEAFPDDGKRYEIIDGELYVSKQPHYYHQLVCNRLGARLQFWCDDRKTGQASQAPGIIFDDDDDVAPDVIWISSQRLATTLGSDGKIHGAPELVIEVLSPGSKNERRDREAKLKLYSRRGVGEYWIVDWPKRLIEIYRREQAQLHLLCTLYESDALTTPLLPGFSLSIANLFDGIPSG
jgi:Uma2 family endonuclease